jgi:IS5 family transposase
MPKGPTKRRHVNPIGGLFARQDRSAKLAQFLTPLDKLNAAMAWERFRPVLERLVPRADRSAGGRPPFDHILMFKILVLQTYYGLSDERAEFDILDRASFQRFLGLELEDRVPDRTSIWNFKEALGEEGAAELFAAFDGQLHEAGLLATKGKMVDAQFVDVPKQRNSRDENKRIKGGGDAPEDWSPQKRAQKDVDARWATKNKETHFGYKNHVKANRKTKLIERYEVTDASVHDSQAIDQLLEESDGEVFADSAYRSKEISTKVKSLGIRNRIHERAYRNKPLTEVQKETNRGKSRIRARVEHVFGFLTGTMRADRIRTIGIGRARRGIGMANLVYNMARSVQLGVSFA